MPALPPLIHDKSRMRRRACTDLCGGRSAMVVPTATVIARHGAVIDVFQHGNDSDLRPGRYALRFPSLRHSGLRVFCFIGSALNNTGFPPIKQTLACDSKPPRSLSCPKENGAERLYVKWNSLGVVARQQFSY